MSRKKTTEAIVHDMILDMVSRVQTVYRDKEALLIEYAPEQVGMLALGLASFAMSIGARTLLPQIRDIRGVIEELAPKDRLALALLAARATESTNPVAAVRADMAALRRMGRCA